MNNGFGNWSDVRVFLAVLRGGSTLAAGKLLGMAQPTVTRRLDALEHALGAPLFIRSTRGANPLPLALALKPHAEAMETAAEALSDTARRAADVDQKVIRFTAPSQSFSPKLAEILSGFTQERRDVRFDLISSQKVLDLATGEADVGLRFAQAIDDDRLVATKLTEVRSSVYASSEYVARHGKPERLSDFAGHRFVVIESEYARAFHSQHWLAANLGEGLAVTKASTLEGLITALLAGMGVGMMPNSMAQDHPTLVHCMNAPPETFVKSWLVISPDAWRRPEVKQFSKYFAPRFRKIYSQ